MNTPSFDERAERGGEQFDRPRRGPGRGRRRGPSDHPHRGPGGHGPGGHGGPGPFGRGRRGGPRGEEGEFERGEERGPRRGGRRGFGRPGGWQNVDLPPADDAQAWFEGRLPDSWFSDVTVSVDREEIIVVGTLADVEDGIEQAGAEGRISRHRADTRDERMSIADEAQQRYGRKVSWGARAGDVETLFTHISVPVMTRLQQPERQVLDTLVDSGVARSRSEALSWAVRLVGEHTESWLSDLRNAMSEVDKLRSEGPEL